MEATPTRRHYAVKITACLGDPGDRRHYAVKITVCLGDPGSLGDHRHYAVKVAACLGDPGSLGDLFGPVFIHNQKLCDRFTQFVFYLLYQFNIEYD